MVDHRAHPLMSMPPEFGGSGDGICERQERDSHCLGVCRPKKEFCRTEGTKVSTAGKTEAAVCRYVQEPEQEGQRLDPLAPSPL